MSAPAPIYAIGPNSIKGPIYWIRIISYITGASIAFGGSNPVPVRGLHGWQAGGCGGWDHIELTGVSEVEYANVDNLPYPGGIGTEGTTIDSANNAIVTPSISPNLLTGGGTRGAQQAFALVTLVASARLFAISNNAQPQVLRIKRLTIYNPGSGGAGLYQLALNRYKVKPGGVAINTVGVRKLSANWLGPSVTEVQAPLTGIAGSDFVDAAYAFAIYVPAALGPFAPIIYDFDGIVLPMIEISGKANDISLVLEMNATAPAGHDGNFAFGLEYTLE